MLSPAVVSPCYLAPIASFLFLPLLVFFGGGRSRGYFFSSTVMEVASFPLTVIGVSVGPVNSCQATRV